MRPKGLFLKQSFVSGDYYYIKAGNELLNQGLMNCSNGQVAVPATPTSPNSPQTSQQTNGGIALTSVFWPLVWPSGLLGFLIEF
jgi:hypothetical protein